MRAYEDRAAADDILIGDTPKARRRRHRLDRLKTPGRLWKHSRMSDVGDLVGEDFLVCALVRNPWDRMVSYYYWLRAQSFSHPAVAIAKSQEFKAFLRDPSIQNAERNSAAKSYVRGSDGANRQTVFVRIEFPDDFAPVWEHLGFRLTLPHLNASERAKDWRVYYGPEEIEIVADLAGQDIAQFGYSPE